MTLNEFLRLPESEKRKLKIGEVELNNDEFVRSNLLVTMKHGGDLMIVCAPENGRRKLVSTSGYLSVFSIPA